MTSRERVLAALRHETADKVPFTWAFGVNEGARNDLGKYLKKTPNQINRMLWAASDVRFVNPRYIGPADRTPVWVADKVDIWGVGHRNVFNGFDYYAEFSSHPLKGLGETKKLEDHVFPSPDWFDFSVIPRQIEAADAEGGEHAIIIGKGSPFEFSWYMTGFEYFLGLLLTEPEIANQLIEKVTDYFVEYLSRGLEAARGRIDIGFTADDMGHQKGLLMSLDLWRKLVKPHHVRLNKKLHSFGVKILYHTCGAVMDAVDEIIDMGVDVLEALQFDAHGMDPNKLKSQYGDRLCFHGGVSVQKTLPYGTPEEVRKEVRERIATLGKNGGYILAPSHAVQGGTPPENIIALLEEIGRFYPDQPDTPVTFDTVIP